MLGPTTKGLTAGDVYGLVAASAVCQLHSDEHEILDYDQGSPAQVRSQPGGEGLPPLAAHMGC